MKHPDKLRVKVYRRRLKKRSPTLASHLMQPGLRNIIIMEFKRYALGFRVSKELIDVAQMEHDAQQNYSIPIEEIVDDEDY